MRGSVQTDRKRAVFPPACYPESLAGSASSAGVHPAALWETKGPFLGKRDGAERKEPAQHWPTLCVSLKSPQEPRGLFV